MKEIDVHCLIHKPSPFYPLLENQMAKEECNFYPISNGSHIGKGRAEGFLLGNAPYVSYVDYDDLIQPGIFREIITAFKAGYDWLYTDEMLMDENGYYLQPGWSSHPHLYPQELLSFMRVGGNGNHCHHLIAFKRECLKLVDFFMLRQLHELSETYLYLMLGKSLRFFHLPEVGYFWRQHEGQACRQFESFKVIEKWLERKQK